MRDLEISRAPEKVDVRIAWVLFAFTFVLLWATEASIGYPRDESFYFYAGHAFAGWFTQLLHAPAQAVSDPQITRFLDYNHEHPMLMKELFGLSLLVFHLGLHWLKAATAMRLPAFAVAASIPAVLHLYGSTLYGRRAGLFAALSFLVVPRQFFNAHLACFDVPIAAAWLVVVYLFWRAMTDRRYWLWCGLAFGAAVATKHNAWFLPFALAPFVLARALKATRNEASRSTVWKLIALFAAIAVGFALCFVGLGPETFIARFEPLSPMTALFTALVVGGAVLLRRLSRENVVAFRALATFWAICVFGPAIFYLHWPYLWHHPIERTAWYFNFHATHVHYAWMYLGTLMREPPFPLEYVFAVTALTVPLSIVLPMALGLFRLLGRTVAGALRRTAWPSSSELLVGVNALASILLISAPSVPHFGGVKHWFASMLFLGLLAGETVSRAADALVEWLKPRVASLKPAPTFAALAALLLAPAAIATARFAPYGTSFYGELAGGLPGAATLGMQRQFWSNNVTGVFPWINANAPQGARVWFHEVTDLSFREYQASGMLRRDLIPVGGPEQAQLAAYQYHQEFREQEFAIWQAFGTQKPVAGLYLEETPQVIVYARP